MTNDLWLALCIFLMGAGVMGGIFFTKMPGFGRFTMSVLLFTVVPFVVALFFAFGKVEASLFANIVFAVAGFAGGAACGGGVNET